jgi:hypothetical protein
MTRDHGTLLRHSPLLHAHLKIPSSSAPGTLVLGIDTRSNRLNASWCHTPKPAKTDVAFKPHVPFYS